jgi:hypothetical protein
VLLAAGARVCSTKVMQRLDCKVPNWRRHWRDAHGRVLTVGCALRRLRAPPELVTCLLKESMGLFHW